MAVTVPVTVQSANGRMLRLLKVLTPPASRETRVRGVYLTNGGRCFTISNGATLVMRPMSRAAEACFATQRTSRQNCIISSNSAGQGGGIYGGMVNNCSFIGNSAELQLSDLIPFSAP